ncbi:MAG: hypothetical protein CME06_11990 [Gemmatimonadetes bacterium]|nr:hypothetical protein [Gemmatimonadota bacterium]
MIDAIDVPAVLTSRAGETLHVNDAATRILTQLPEAGSLFDSLCVGTDEEELTPPTTGTLVLETRRIEWTARPIESSSDDCVIFTFHDRDERDSLARQVAHLDRLASVGEVMASIAHELNNPLTSIIMAMEVLPKKGREARRELLRQVRKDTARALDLARKVLAFGRNGSGGVELIRPNALLKSALDLVGADLRKSDIQVRFRQGRGLPLIEGDLVELRQVLVNLLINARQALEGCGARREVELRSRRGSRHVEIEVSDSGAGIEPAVLRRIFEPFYTTKPKGEGTGLGLCISRGIIEAHRGELSVRSAPGEGSTFTITLPPAKATPSDSAPAPEPLDEVECDGTKRVLVVDDEEVLAELLREILEEAGYEVDTACSVESALERINAQVFDIIMSDVRMPGLGGRDLYRKLEQDEPSLARRMVFMTGDVVSPETVRFFERTRAPHLSKPFRLRELNQALRSLNQS